MIELKDLSAIYSDHELFLNFSSVECITSFVDDGVEGFAGGSVDGRAPVLSGKPPLQGQHQCPWQRHRGSQRPHSRLLLQQEARWQHR